MSQERIEQVWKKLKQVDGEAGESFRNRLPQF